MGDSVYTGQAENMSHKETSLLLKAQNFMRKGKFGPAMPLLRKAALEMNSFVASANLAECYWTGESMYPGVPMDRDKAAQFYRLALKIVGDRGPGAVKTIALESRVTSVILNYSYMYEGREITESEHPDWVQELRTLYKLLKSSEKGQGNAADYNSNTKGAILALRRLFGALAYDAGDRAKAVKYYRKVTFKGPSGFPAADATLSQVEYSIKEMVRKNDETPVAPIPSTPGTFRIQRAKACRTEIPLLKCANCGTEQLVMSKCSMCKSVHYCNKDCQVKAWKEHEPGCNSR